ncbi:MAG: threonine-phosphate decarboxylase CobD [Hyphomicrobiales bacterium]|nr:threonine-phosphate decarboxylase CobD [Hyphomicrobiales bacterium]
MKHGGDPPGDGWLDLSTGISPFSYPLTQLPGEAWTRLPTASALKRLHVAARHAYRCAPSYAVVAAPGTQILIQLIPFLRPGARVGVVSPTYAEHAACWRLAGSDVALIGGLEESDGCDVAVVVNPNNPDGRTHSPDPLAAAGARLAKRGGFLVVDEAFADCAPEISVCGSGGDGLIALRSFGKFYGMAGLRLGFAVGAPALMEKLAALLGPWAVSGPALHVGEAALRDAAWAEKARREHGRLADRLDGILRASGCEIVGGAPLYRLAAHPQAGRLHANLASRRIWTRVFDFNPAWVRFGLPGSDDDFARLEAALAEFTDQSSA